MVNRKLKGGASKEQKLLEACLKGKGETITKMLIKGQVNVSCRDTTDGVSPLHIVAELGYEECCETLLKYGADVGARLISTGETPLHLAALSGSVGCVKHLLRYKADMYIPDKNGVTPIEASVCINSDSSNFAFGEMLKLVSFVDWKNSKGNTLLMESAIVGNGIAIDLLFEKQANPNIKNEIGNTALHLAALNGKVSSITSLMNFKPDTSLKNNAGHTASDCAIQIGFSQLAKVLNTNFQFASNSYKRTDTLRGGSVRSSVDKNSPPVSNISVPSLTTQSSSGSTSPTRSSHNPHNMIPPSATVVDQLLPSPLPPPPLLTLPPSLSESISNSSNSVPPPPPPPLLERPKPKPSAPVRSSSFVLLPITNNNNIDLPDLSSIPEAITLPPPPSLLYDNLFAVRERRSSLQEFEYLPPPSFSTPLNLSAPEILITSERDPVPLPSLPSSFPLPPTTTTTTTAPSRLSSFEAPASLEHISMTNTTSLTLNKNRMSLQLPSSSSAQAKAATLSKVDLRKNTPILAAALASVPKITNNNPPLPQFDIASLPPPPPSMMFPSTELPPAVNMVLPPVNMAALPPPPPAQISQFNISNLPPPPPLFLASFHHN